MAKRYGVTEVVTLVRRQERVTALRRRLRQYEVENAALRRQLAERLTPESERQRG